MYVYVNVHLQCDKVMQNIVLVSIKEWIFLKMTPLESTSALAWIL